MNTPTRIGCVLGCAAVPLLFGIMMVIAGLVLYRNSQFVKAEPQPITCRELSDHGPGDNAHVLLSDFQVATDAWVVQDRDDYDDPEVAWIPLFPTGEDEPEVFHVILLSKRAVDLEDVEQLADEQEIQGIVENVAGFITPTQRDTLADAFPGSTLDNCYLITHEQRGYTPPPASAGLACAGVGGVITLLMGLGIAVALILALRRSRARPAEFQSGAGQAALGATPGEAIMPGIAVPASSAAGHLPRDEAAAEPVLLEDAEAGDEHAAAADAAQPASVPAGEHAPPELVWFRGMKSWGIGSSQKGIIVLRPDFAVFLPTHGRVNAFGELAKATVAVAGVHTIDLSSPREIDRVVQHLWESNPHTFDQNVHDVAMQQGGTVFLRTDARASRNRGRRTDTVQFWSSTARLTGFATPSPLLDRLLAGWSKAAAPLGPTIRAVAFAASLPTVIALIALIVWASHHGHPSRDLGTVTVDQALDAKRVPAGNVVSITADVDLETIWTEEDGRGDLTFIDRSSPRLIFYCPQNHPFGRTVRRFGDPDAEQQLNEPWTFTGRIYDGGDVKGAGDVAALREYAQEELGLDSLDEARVLSVGQPPFDDPPPVPLLAFYVWGGIALLAWLMLPVAIYRQRSTDRYAAEGLET